jgi:hypothetical protein
MKACRHIILSLVLAGLVFPGMASRAEPAGAADDPRLALDYTVYIGGFRVVDIGLKAELADRAYRINMDLKAQGLLHMILDWSMSANSSGQIQGGKIVPIEAGHDSRWRGKERRIRLLYPGIGPPTVESVPPAKSDDRRVVRPEDRLGARDLAGGILATLLAVGGADSCTHTEPVFDGRRRFDIVFDEVARDQLKPSDYSPFGGMALRCTLTIKRIAGFRQKQSRYRWMSGGKATVWIGRVFAGAPPVMVRMEMETAFGPLRAHLSGAARHPGGEILRLPPAR